MAETVELSRDELEVAKQYIRPPEDESDLAVVNAVQSAREYLRGAGVALPSPASSRRFLYDTVCHALALSYYEDRNSLISGQVLENPVFRRNLNQLKLTEPVTGQDTGNEEVSDNADDEGT